MEIKLIISNGIISLAGISISAIVGYFFGRRKYIFEKSHDKKLLVIEEIYKKLILLRQEIREYIYFIAENNDLSVKERTEKLNKVKNNFHIFQKYFWVKEIFLSNIMSEKINELIEQFIKITSSSTSALFQKAVQKYGNGQDMYLRSLDEMKKFEEALEDLKKEFQKNNEK